MIIGTETNIIISNLYLDFKTLCAKPANCDILEIHKATFMSNNSVTFMSLNSVTQITVMAKSIENHTHKSYM